MGNQTLSERAAILIQVVGGRVDLVSEVATWTNQALVAASGEGRLVLRHDAVATVLRRYSSGELSREVVQAWASFVRWGLVQDPRGGPAVPVDIEFEEPYEDAIVEAIGRLDELGDTVDGELRSGEADELLTTLGAGRATAH